MPITPSGSDGTPEPAPPPTTPSGKRRFSSSERAALYLAADGRCACGAELQTGWHADHIHPYSQHGPTDVTNGQALCPSCNLKKGDQQNMQLRQWQRRAMDAFYASSKPNFLVSATPGAGKTKFALYLAQELLKQGTIERVAVVAPSDNLREQWAEEAGKAGLHLFPVPPGDEAGYDKVGYQGSVVTYQQLLGAGRDLVRRSMRRPTLAILDEVHHAGDNKAWGESLVRAVEMATHRLCLTGTPWRKDPTSPIPFVDYNSDGMVTVDYAYEYGAAVADGVCRRIEFHAYDGEARWADPARARRDSSGPDCIAKLGEDMSEEDVSAALDAVYEPKYAWMPSILGQADEMLTELREDVPDAAGLIVAERKFLAHGYADLLEKITGSRPPVVVSDPKTDPRSEIAKGQIDRFRKGGGRWIVAVKMISEGVDIPRLAVGVYASKTQTPLFFRQVVGRLVRTRADEELNARLLIPAVPDLLSHAREIEEELRHQLEVETKAAERADQEGSPGQGQLDFREPRDASESVFDRAIMSGDEVTPDEVNAAQDLARQLGLPIRFAVNLVPIVRGRAAPTEAAQPAEPARQVEIPRHRREKVLRGEVETLARKVAFKRGVRPNVINGDLIRAGHPKRSMATVEQLEAIHETLLRWSAEL